MFTWEVFWIFLTHSFEDTKVGRISQKWKIPIFLKCEGVDTQLQEIPDKPWTDHTQPQLDKLPGMENTFQICNFWFLDLDFKVCIYWKFDKEIIV